ncbi:aminoglycoside phosphotransferase family protein [Microlunatus ginsengisoli]|uniref:Aminoglycoside phosphotransferase family protein n=1 Tax=Microlunatus ginsengisoli TaxID=363863 RepID=A0ABP7A7K4_9ACTN
MIDVPAGFRAMPRWWSEGTDWLDRLPALVEEQCRRWSLEPDGSLRHGSNALVVPVRRGREPLVLRLTPAGPEVSQTVAALRFWAGRGTVLLLDADPDRGALLLERLDAERSLAALPVARAMPVIGRLVRRLAAPVTDPAVRSTGEVAVEEAAGWPRRWSALGEPVPARLLDSALRAAEAVVEPHTPDAAVDADLHFEQVLGGIRESWLVVDPVLLRGDGCYDLGRVLWSRLDELGSDEDVRGWLRLLADAAGADRERARQWVLCRSMSYLLWGLERGLTEDPPRCRRLLAIFAQPGARRGGVRSGP